MNGIDAVMMCLYFFATSWWQMGILFAIRSCTSIIVNIIYLAIRQETTPNRLLGRVAGTSSTLMKLTLPIGLFLSGIWAEYLSIPYLFLISAGILSVISIFLLKSNFKSIE